LCWTFRAYGEIINAYRTLIGNSEGKGLLGRTKHRCGILHKLTLQEKGFKDVDWIVLVQNMAQ